MKTATFLILASILFLNCKNRESETQNSDDLEKNGYYTEDYRPQYHFTPESHWMNDPNGLVFKNGTYHLFYQYYPDDIVWGPMHWGHATSKNLKKWEHKPIALYPDSLGYIFSGSAVVDKRNTSGLGTKENPPLVAIFTYHDPKGDEEGRTDYQYQGIAYSLDNGDSWKKYEGNPVLPNTESFKDFRDPKVFWDKKRERWVLLLVAGDHARFYSSQNLKDWEYRSDFGQEYGAHGGVWECPDLFKLSVEDSEEEKWVLLISINPGGPNGGSATQYFIGDFDGNTFTTDQKEPKWLDYGTDNYAGITYNNEPNEKRIFIGWMSNWNYAEETPTSAWRSSMTLPRELSLTRLNGAYVLKNFPLETFLETSGSKKIDVLPYTSNSIQQSRIDFQIPNPVKDFELVFGNQKGDLLKINYKEQENMFYLDRSQSGKTDFSEQFAHQIQIAPAFFTPQNGMDITVFLDRSSVEFFVDKGMTVMTAQIFPDEPYDFFNIITEANPAQIHFTPQERIWPTR